MRRQGWLALWLVVPAFAQWGCLEPIDRGGPGFSCESDADCGDAGPCLSGICGAGEDAQPAFPVVAVACRISYPRLWSRAGKVL